MIHMIHYLHEQHDTSHGGEKMTKRDEILTSSTETWMVHFEDHDYGAAGSDFLRPTKKLAERSADLMRQCGYQTVTVRQWTK